MKITPQAIVRGLAALASLWFVAVIGQGLLAGQGLTFIPVSFALSGQFGDSFGVLGAVMAAAAAIGAWIAVGDQRAALNKAKVREDDLQKVAERRDFESTYFNLLNAFDRIVAQMDVGKLFWARTGKDTFSFFVEKLHQTKLKSDADFRAAYESVFESHRDDLAHYFRTLFNIVQFVKATRPNDAYFYIKLIRATLSESELIMLALNGLYHPEGEKNFKPLIEEFALLNNISDAAKADYDLRERYGLAAFDRPDNGSIEQSRTKEVPDAK